MLADVWKLQPSRYPLRNFKEFSRFGIVETYYHTNILIGEVLRRHDSDAGPIDSLVPPNIVELVKDKRCGPTVLFILHPLNEELSGMTSGECAYVLIGSLEPVELDYLILEEAERHSIGKHNCPDNGGIIADEGCIPKGVVSIVKAFARDVVVGEVRQNGGVGTYNCAIKQS